MRIALVVLAAFFLLASRADARILPQAQQAWHLLDAAAKADRPALHLIQLDDGGGSPHVNYNRDKMVAILLAIIPGFGLGHFWINDSNGFVTFLLVDTVLWTGFIFLPWVVDFRWPFGVLLFLGKVWQVYDVVRATGGAGGDEPSFLPPPRPEVRRDWAETAMPAVSLAF